jgi:hypothetical protein
LGEFRFPVLELTLLFGEAGIERRLLALSAVERVLEALQITKVGLATFDGCFMGLQVVAEGVQGLPVAAEGGLLLAKGVQANGELPLGFIKAGGLLGEFFLTPLDLPIELTVARFELLAKLRLAPLEVLSLASEFLGVALVRIQLAATGLQVCFAAVEGSQTLPARALLGGADLNQRLNLALPLQKVLLARFELPAAGELLLLDLIELGGPLGKVFLAAKEGGPLGVQAIRAGAFVRFEALALLLQGLDGGIEFLLASIQINLEAIQGDALLPELALVGGQLDFVLPEPPQETLVLVIRVCSRGTLLGVRFRHSACPRTVRRTPVTEHPPAFAPQWYRIRGATTTGWLQFRPLGLCHACKRR